MSRFPGWTEKDVLRLEHLEPKKTGKENKSKYRARQKEYKGIIYDSTLEARYAAELDYRLKANEIKEWERQVKFPLVVNNILICTYIIDFVITKNDGTKEYIEIKGFETKDWKIKKKLFTALFPGLNYSIIKSKWTNEKKSVI